MNSIIALLASLVALASAQTQQWTETIVVTLDSNQPATLYNGVLSIPYLSNGLTISVQNASVPSFQLCLKQNVAAPPAAGFAGWGGVYCDLYSFGNGTTAAKRAEYRRSELRGRGSAHGDVADARALARRSVAAVDWSQTLNVRSGLFFATAAGDKMPTANTTIELQLSGTTCTNGGFGPQCVAAQSLALDVAVPLNVAAGASVLFQYSGAELNATVGSMSIAVGKQNGNESATVYWRWAGVASSEAYDVASAVPTAAAAFVASYPSPRAATWFFLFQNDNATAFVGNFTLSVKQCGAAGYGPLCNTTTASVGAPGVVTDYQSWANGDGAYYRFDGNTALALAAASDDATQSAPLLYAKLGSVPSAADYDYAQCNVAPACPQAQRVLITPLSDVVAQAQAQQWFVLVQATAGGGVSVWNANACANNCTTAAQGNCTLATSVCTCDSAFLGYDCSESRNALERWEWALIIGGGVLVAIGLIGCVVYFIQKQNKRKGFERV